MPYPVHFVVIIIIIIIIIIINYLFMYSFISTASLM